VAFSDVPAYENSLKIGAFSNVPAYENSLKIGAFSDVPAYFYGCRMQYQCSPIILRHFMSILVTNGQGNSWGEGGIKMIKTHRHST
jgi:hypothetical protein